MVNDGREARSKTRLLFLHGLGGRAEVAWGKLPEFLMADRKIAERFSVGFYSFPTSLFRLPFSTRAPKIQELAAGLRTQIEHDEFECVDLVCHSLGGLIARRYLIEEVKAQRRLRVGHLALFAVPNNGAGLASIARFLSWRQNQIKQLCKEADIIEFLNEDWFRFDVQNKIRTKFIVGTQDEVVDRRSVAGYWGNPDVETIIGRGHLNIVKPERADDLAVRILQRFLTAEKNSDGMDSFIGPATVEGKSAEPKFFYYISKQKVEMLSEQLAPIPKGMSLVSAVIRLADFLLDRNQVADIADVISDDSTRFIKDSDVWRQGLFNFLATGTNVVTFVAFRRIGPLLILLVGSPRNILGEQIVKDGMHVPGTSGALLDVLSFIKNTLNTEETRAVLVGGGLPFYGSRVENTHSLADSALDLAPNSVDIVVPPGGREKDPNWDFNWNTFSPKRIAIFCQHYLGYLPQQRSIRSSKYIRHMSKRRMRVFRRFLSDLPCILR
jgi:hypothetical protein